MNRIEAPSRYGRVAVRNAEPPAKPAANINGKTGKQQVDAAKMLPMAAILASVVRAPVCLPGALGLVVSFVALDIFIALVLRVRPS
jgi:hypothetical protein